MVNADNLFEETRGARREKKKRQRMAVHGSGMKKLAAKLSKQKK